MRTNEKPKTPATNGAAPEAAMSIVATIAGTTWRMFVPVMTGVLGGLWVDYQLNTKPLLTFIGLGLGVIAAILLVRQQLRSVMKGRANV